MPLKDFLLARIAEDEAVASRGLSCGDAHPTMDVYHRDGHPNRRAVAECEAKRRIVALHSGGHECSQYDHNGDVDNCTYAQDFDDCSTLCLLAAVYADHPDYRAEEWHPERWG